MPHDVDREGAISIARPRLWTSGPVRASLLAWILTALAFGLAGAGVSTLVVSVLFAFAIISGSFYFAREAASELVRERKVGIELLMTAAIVGAAALGRWREGALVAALYSISEALEGFTIQRTRFAIRNLMDMVPPRARVVRDGKEADVDVQDVRVGELFQVRPGESIPVDGVVREGTSTVDESAVTGESLPADKGVKAAVFAGSINGNGALLIEATKPFAESMVSKIIALVENAQQQKGKAQLFIERFGNIYSPAVLGSALLLALVPLVLGLDGHTWASRAVSFLVAASPCALAVATPVTLVAAIGSAAKRGVLIKGGAILEVLGGVRAVALDKTGTLTFGKPVVTGVHAPITSPGELLHTAAAVEHYSEHPLAAAILRAADEHAGARPSASGFRALTGLGVEAMVEGRRVAVLKPDAAVEQGAVLSPEAVAWREAAQSKGETVVVVVREQRVEGLISLADTVRPHARQLVQALRAVGVQHVVMLTGDNENTARAIAAQVGIDEYYGPLLPEQKVKKIEELKAKYGKVAMVGDGINDAPALATASVGIAMGTAGSDAALAAADVALVADDLSKLGYAIELGRRSRRVILQNIVTAAVIVLALVVATLGAGLGMFGAVIGHEGSEVVIILNGLRVALWRPVALQAGPGTASGK